ncbi:hypothetical protein Agub_g2817, partial [Astrephomene gubernaculifera]
MSTLSLVALIVVALAAFPNRCIWKSRSGYGVLVSGQVAIAASACQPLRWNPSAASSCTVFDDMCVDHGSMLITHEHRYQIENVRRQDTPGLPAMKWNLPMRVNSYPDALGGWQPDFQVMIRPVSKVEPTPPLRHPNWSNCTLPVIIMGDFLYNYKTFVTKVLTDVDSMFRIKGLAPDYDATLVLATPSGLALEPYHAALLSPYSRRPLITLAELGRRGLEGRPAQWATEGVRVHCFSKVLACKLDQRENTPPHHAANAVISHLGAAVPPDPLGFGAAGAAAAAGGGWDESVLRVVVEARSAPWRSLKNVEEILRACEQANAQGFSAGPFRRILCKPLPASYDSALPATGSVDLSGPAATALYGVLGAVRSAHLFISISGSSGAHAFFMQHSSGEAGAGQSGSGLIEVRPCGWGSAHAGRADGAPDAMMGQLQRGDDAIRFFAYNVEDTAQCSPPDFEPALRTAAANGSSSSSASAASYIQPQPIHTLENKSPPRYSPAELLVRDQHLTLKPAPLLAMV